MSDDRVVLHLDMDAFYASVEQRERPELRGRPVVVGADPEQGEGRGVVAAASYEARRYGIHSAQPISKAWRNCPGAEFVRPRFELYERVSRRVMGLVEQAVDVLEPVSIDEAYADVTDSCGGSFERGREVALGLRRRLEEATGLTCSVGLAPNKLVAKIAADEDKPNSLTIVRPAEVGSFLAERDADVIPGIGPKTYASLASRGIETVAELAALEPDRARSLLGSPGPTLVQRARGRDPRPVDPTHERKSVGAERTFPEDVDPEQARERLASVARTASQRLQEAGHQARTVAIKVRLAPFETFTRQRSLEAPTDEGDVVEELARELFDEMAPDREVRLLGVRLSSLVRDGPAQTRLDRWPQREAGDVLGPRPWEQETYWRFG